MSIFNCIKCTLPYNKIDKKPKSLPCGHIFCEKCVSSFIKEDSNKIICHTKRFSKNIVLCFGLI